MSRSIVIGVDVGGTFTDFTLLDERTGQLHYHKTPSTPGDPSEAVEIGLDETVKTHKMDPKEIVETYLKDSDIALFKHPERDCVYEEAELIKQVKFDSLEFVQSQMVFYQSRSFGQHKGLYELPCRIQRNTLEIQALMLTWWELICKFSSRDQLSLPFALDMHGITPAIMPGRANGLMLNEILPQVITSDHQR